MAQKPLEILVVGSGAVGSIFGARAQGARSRVTAVCRSNYDVAASSGIAIRSILWGNSIFNPNRVVKSPSDVSHVEFDYVVLATKLGKQSNRTLVDSIRPVIRPKTCLVSVQNGIDAEIALRQAFRNPVFSSTCYISCSQKQPGIVEHVSSIRPHAFYMGINRPGTLSSGEKELASFVSLDSAFTKVDDAHVERWRKMIFNTAWSLSTSLMDCNTHEVLRDDSGLRLVSGLAQEAYRVGRMMGINLPTDIPKYTVESAGKAPALVPSMLQDIRAGKPIEVEALCGGILRMAKEKGIDTPILESIYGFLSRLNDDLESRNKEPMRIPVIRPAFNIPAIGLSSIPALL
ncbi:hypothetical protein AAFC00_006039 [Neodothiora populina]|uniref:2-dehydropantoate 2-reductase n=1 Tax=Neodothiora populina TaxID=2781224 RepID=A0ABR3P6V7_9PEZI